MATQVTRYVADDGSEWETMALALRQDEVIKLSDIIKRMTVYDNIDPTILLTALVVGDLGKEVAEFRARHG